MPYRYLEDVATADVAFEAWGDTLEELFKAAGDATMNVMVEDLNSIEPKVNKTLKAEAEDLEMLLFQFMQELIYYKDSEKLLLRVEKLEIEGKDCGFALEAEAFGEELDPDKHTLLVDVKAVTMHRFRLEQTDKGWEASVILDI